MTRWPARDESEAARRARLAALARAIEAGTYAVDVDELAARMLDHEARARSLDEAFAEAKAQLEVAPVEEPLDPRRATRDVSLARPAHRRKVDR
jgi:hypothetical protein